MGRPYVILPHRRVIFRENEKTSHPRCQEPSRSPASHLLVLICFYFLDPTHRTYLDARDPFPPRPTRHLVSSLPCIRLLLSRSKSRWIPSVKVDHWVYCLSWHTPLYFRDLDTATKTWPSYFKYISANPTSHRYLYRPNIIRLLTSSLQSANISPHIARLATFWLHPPSKPAFPILDIECGLRMWNPYVLNPLTPQVS